MIFKPLDHFGFIFYTYRAIRGRLRLRRIYDNGRTAAFSAIGGSARSRLSGFCAIGASASGGESNCMYFVYVLKSASHGTRYVGSTNDIKQRLKEHNNGKCKYTSGRMPWKLEYSEEYDTRVEAMRREKFLKTGKGREYLDNLMIN